MHRISASGVQLPGTVNRPVALSNWVDGETDRLYAVHPVKVIATPQAIKAIASNPKLDTIPKIDKPVITAGRISVRDGAM